MVAQRDDSDATSAQWIEAGFAGRPHGLDGSFHVNVPRSTLLTLGGRVSVDGRLLEIVRLAGTEARPIVRLQGVDDRDAAEALRGRPLLVEAGDAPALDPGEFWAHELEGCLVHDAGQALGRVRRLIELPSCEALEVELSDGGELLVPMVRDAIRSVDVDGGSIDVDARFLGADAIAASGSDRPARERGPVNEPGSDPPAQERGPVNER